MSRAFGSESSWVLSKLAWTRVEVTSIGGASLVTVTSSDIVLTPSLAGIFAVTPMPMRTLSFEIVAKPPSSNLRV